MTQQEKTIEVSMPENMRSGVYANNMMVTHTREEFIIDYLMVAPPAGAVTARVICSPGHMKRIIAALQANLKQYESAFGSIKAADEPKGQIGFRKE